MSHTPPHSYPGRLIVVEGIDGSGKSTQMDLLADYLQSRGFGVLKSAWNSSPDISPVIRKAKKKQILTPYAFSLLHAADFSFRYTYEILPAMEAGMIVLSDRYIFTAIARDCARGIPKKWLVSNFRFAIVPDLTFLFRVDPETSYQRITRTRPIKFYEAGMDMNLSTNPRESYTLFQSRVLSEYEAMKDEYGFHVVDATLSLERTQARMRRLLGPIIRSLS